MNTAQRVSASDASDNFVFARSVLAYREAARRIAATFLASPSPAAGGGRVLEIGTGTGYGIETLSPVCQSLTTVDKHQPSSLATLPDNVQFHRSKVPPLEFPAASFDFVVAFQLIEHLRDDFGFLSEVQRVLKHGGQFIVTTPNRTMSLTRNPWHVREYSPGELNSLMESRFDRVEALGVFGNERAMEYYERNKAGVDRITRLDPLRLRDRLPRWMLRVPYDVANRLNRHRLLAENEQLTRNITSDDFRIFSLAAAAENNSLWPLPPFDLFYVGTKV